MDIMQYLPQFGQNIPNQVVGDQMPMDDATAQLLLKRRMAQADALRNQQAPQGQMVSGHYVAPSWTQYLANAIGQYQGIKKEKEAMKEYGQFQKDKTAKLSELLRGQKVEEAIPGTEEMNMPGMVQETYKPYSREEFLSRATDIMPEIGDEMVKAQVGAYFKEDQPMVVGKNLVTKSGKVLYSAPEDPKSPYTNVQRDEQTGKVYGFNIKTNQMEEVPGATLTPKPKMTDYEAASLKLRQDEINKKEANNFDSETIDMLADQALAGDKSVFSGRGMTGANIGAVRQRMNQKMRDKGWSGRDIAAANAEFMGIMAGERSIGTKGANIELAGSEFTNIVPLAKQSADKVVRSGFLPFGKVEVMFNEQTNDPNMSAFAAYNNGLINTYARAISPTGVPTVSDKDHARQLLLTAKNKAAYDATVDALTREINAAKRSPRETRENLRSEITGRNKSSGLPSSDDIAAEIARRQGRK